MTLPSSTSSTESCGGKNCPTDTLLLGLLEDTLSDTQLQQCEAQLEHCLQCQARLDQLTDCQRWRSELMQQIQVEPDGQTTDWPFLTDTHPRAAQSPVDLALVIPGDRFSIREKIGRGGGGTVFRAWDNTLRREVALKIPHLLTGQDEKRRARFEVEALATARLNHPNIVPLFDASFAEDSCFLVTEYIPGMSLAEWLRQLGLERTAVPLPVLLELGISLAEAVELAHQTGIIHRDLKPSNVLLDTTRRQGELPFLPRITDFGLARLEESDLHNTTSGDVFGSFPYMAPEQIEGDRLTVGPACDVYALGVILYELATGRLPFMHVNPAEMLRMIMQQSPTAPHKLREDLPPDLEAVILKALEKRPQERYPSAATLAEDLRHVLRGEPVSVRRPGMLERTRRWLRQNPAFARIASVIAVAVTVVIATLLISNQQQFQLNSALEETNTRLSESLSESVRLQQLAENAQRQAEEQERITKEQLYVSDLRRAGEAWKQRDFGEVEALLRPYADAENSHLRGVEWHILQQKISTPHRVLCRQEGPVYSINFSQDGTLVAATGVGSIVHVVRIADGELVAKWVTDQIESNGVYFDDEDQTIWTTGDDGSICHWEIATGRELKRWTGHTPEQSHEIGLYPEKNWLITTGREGGLRIWDRTTGEPVAHLGGGDKAIPIWNFVIHPNRRLLYGADEKRSIRVWDLEELREVETPLQEIYDRPSCVALSEDGTWLAISSFDKYVKFYNTETWELGAVHHFSDSAERVSIDDERQVAYVLDRIGQVHTIPLPTLGEPTKEFPRDPRTVTFSADAQRAFDARPTPDQRALLTCGYDGTVRHWPLETIDSEKTRDFHWDTIRSTTPSRDGKHILVVTPHQLFLLEPETLEVIHHEQPQRYQYRHSAPLPDNGFAVTEHSNNDTAARVLRVFPYRDKQWPTEWQELPDEIPPLANLWTMSPDGKWALKYVYDSRQGVLFHLSCYTLEAPHTILFDNFDNVHEVEGLKGCGSATFNHQSSQIAIDWGQTLIVWDIATNRPAWVSERFPNFWARLAYSPDDRWLVGSNRDRTIHIWDTQDYATHHVLSGHRAEVTDLAISGDNRTLITSDIEGHLKFWHLPTGKEMYELQFRNPIHQLALDPLGRHLLVTLGGTDFQRLLRIPITGPR